jgi:putative ABC transport system permease protein
MPALTFALMRFARDIRFAVRNFAKRPAFSVITVCSLALGIGGTTAMYSVIYGVIVSPFTYKDVNRLMSVQIIDGSGRSNFSSYPIDQFLEIAERNSVFSGVIASTISDVTWINAGDPQRLRGNHGTTNTFEVMGVPALIGRTTTVDDARDGAEPVVVLGYKFWQRQFGGDARVLGMKMRLNDRIRTVIGVMPPRFMWRGADVYLPDVLRPGQSLDGQSEVHLLARIKPGISRSQAEANLTPIIQHIQRRNPDAFPRKWRVQLLNFKETFPSGITDALWILFGAVGLLLLIACVNVSNLLISHLAERQKEIAIRAALGAGHWRLISQLLSEVLVLALAGGILGALAAFGGLHGIIAMVPPETIPDEAEIALNASVLFFTLGLSICTALLVGIVPALQFSGRDVANSLKQESRSSTGSSRQRLTRNLLVVGEVALSLMLLCGASLMMRTFFIMQSTDLGIRTNQVLTLRIPFANDRYKKLESRNAFLENVLQRIANLPGVIGVGVNTGFAPFGNWDLPVQVEGSDEKDSRSIVLNQTNAGYAKALGLTLLTGRFLSEDDVRSQIHNAVVNQVFVARYFGGKGAIGEIVRVPQLQHAPFNLAGDSFQIVGVIKDTVNNMVDSSAQQRMPEMYIPFTITPLAERIYVACAIRPDSLERSVRQQIYAADHTQPVSDVRTLEAALDQFIYSRPRFNLLLFGVFAGLGLVMALLGVYGVISNGVVQQTREIGIRLALGARSGQVVGMILGASVKLLALGVLGGLIGSLVSARILSRIVQNVSPLDPYSFIGVVLILFTAGLTASFWPARRAARIDPIEALREK